MEVVSPENPIARPAPSYAMQPAIGNASMSSSAYGILSSTVPAQPWYLRSIANAEFAVSGTQERADASISSASRFSDVDLAVDL